MPKKHYNELNKNNSLFKTRSSVKTTVPLLLYSSSFSELNRVIMCLLQHHGFFSEPDLSNELINIDYLLFGKIFKNQLNSCKYD